MINKLKDFINDAKSILIGLLTLAIGILIYFLSNRKKEVNSLRAKIDLVETQKEADLIEVEIKKRMDSKECLSEEVRQLETGLQLLQQKRDELKSSEKDKNASQIEDFWRNN